MSPILESDAKRELFPRNVALSAALQAAATREARSPEEAMLTLLTAVTCIIETTFKPEQRVTVLTAIMRPSMEQFAADLAPATVN